MQIKNESVMYYTPDSGQESEVKTKFTCSRDINGFIHDHCSAQSLDIYSQEHFFSIALNNRNEVLDVRLVAMGTVDSCNVSTKDVFRRLLEHSALARCVLVHNHPSGGRHPSPEDIALTKRLEEAGKLLDIPVLDHIIITPAQNVYSSLRDMGVF